MSLIARLWSMPFFRFGIVGTGGFVVDTVVLYAMVTIGLDRYSGRLVSYLCAATFTWFGNRMITFTETRATGAKAMRAEWLRFLVTNLSGGVVNYAVYAFLVDHSTVVHEYLVLGVAAGALAGMTINFLASRWLVFTADRAR